MIISKFFFEKRRYMEICFVCTGNTCRSVMAERIARKKAKLRKMKDIKFSSCGLFANKENITPFTKKVLKELGYDARDRKSVKYKDKKNTIFVAVTKEHKARIPSPKCLSFADLYGEVIDPFGQDEETYKKTAKMIEKNVDVLLDKIENMRGEI